MSDNLFTIEFPPGPNDERMIRISNLGTQEVKHVVGPKTSRILAALIESPTNENLRQIFEGC